MKSQFSWLTPFVAVFVIGLGLDFVFLNILFPLKQHHFLNREVQSRSLPLPTTQSTLICPEKENLSRKETQE